MRKALENMRVPELLAPAGNMEKLQSAVLYGADAVFLGGPGMHLRAKEAGFPWDEVEGAAAYAHRHGVKAYFCLNAFPKQREMYEVDEALDRLQDMTVDGLIVADLGVALLARERMPRTPLHVSTQANSCNAAAVRFWKDFGAKRVNLARELSFSDIRSIARAFPDVETEVFVHGAMCLAISGRCMLSAYLNERSANNGACTQPCRYSYRPVAVRLREQTRPDEDMWDVVQSGDFSEMFAPEELCLAGYLPGLSKVGVRSLKIEGRMKSASYVAAAVDVYRTALDDLTSRSWRPALYYEELAKSMQRPMSSGFFLPCGKHKRHPMSGDGPRPLVAKYLAPDDDGRHRVSVRAPIEESMDLEIMLPGLRRPRLPAGTFRLENMNGERVSRLNPGLSGYLCCDMEPARPGVFLRGRGAA